MTQALDPQTPGHRGPAGSDAMHPEGRGVGVSAGVAPSVLGEWAGLAVSEQAGSVPGAQARSAVGRSIDSAGQERTTDDEELPLTGDGQLMASSEPEASGTGAWQGATFSVRPEGLLNPGGGPERRRLDVSSGEDQPLSGLPLDGSTRGSDGLERRQSPRPGLGTGSGVGGVVRALHGAPDAKRGERGEAFHVLNDLVECCRDGEYGFHQCAEHAVSVALREQFARQADDFHQAARDLVDCMGRLGERAGDGGSVRGSIHRGWVAVKGTLAGYSDRSLLAQAERGGEAAVARYVQALSGQLPPDVRAVVERQADGVRRNHEAIRAWRRRLQEGD